MMVGGLQASGKKVVGETLGCRTGDDKTSHPSQNCTKCIPPCTICMHLKSRQEERGASRATKEREGSSLYKSNAFRNQRALLSFSFFHKSFNSIVVMVFARSARMFSRGRMPAITMGAFAATGVVYMAIKPESRKVHAESRQQISLWDSLPGENTPVNEGFAKLRGMAAEQRFRTALAQNNGKTDFDVVIGMGSAIYLQLNVRIY